MHTHSSELHLTLMKIEQTISITLETQVSLTTHTFDICFLLFLFLFVTFFYNFSFLGHNVVNARIFLNKRNIRMYIKICKLPNQLCCKVQLSISDRSLQFWYICMLLSEIFKQDKCIHTRNIKKVVKESFPPFICFMQSVIYYELYSCTSKDQ